MLQTVVLYSFPFCVLNFYFLPPVGGGGGGERKGKAVVDMEVLHQILFLTAFSFPQVSSSFSSYPSN